MNGAGSNDGSRRSGGEGKGEGGEASHDDERVVVVMEQTLQ